MVVPMPDAIADETAAQLIAMPLSALMLLEFLQVGRGQWIVQNAANGAVGKALAMLAAARGIPVLGLVRRDDGVGEMAALGVDNVLSTATPDWMDARSEEHTSELQSLMRSSYAVFCLKKKKTTIKYNNT